MPSITFRTARAVVATPTRARLGHRAQRRQLIAWLAPLLLVPLSGCPIPTPIASVLEGTWELTGDVVSPELSNFLITFDRNGEITRLQYQVDAFTVTADDPGFIDGNSSVNSTDINIVVTWLAVNNLVFDGLLNDAQTQIVGTASYQLRLGSITVEAPAGNAVLTKR